MTTKKTGDLRRGSSIIPDDDPITDAAGIRYEEHQKEVLRLAAEARKLMADTPPVAPERAPDLEPLRATRGQLERKLDGIADRINSLDADMKAAAQAEVENKAEREKERARLLAEKDRLARQADEVMREMAVAEATALAKNAAQQIEPGSPAAWREQLAADLAPGIEAVILTRKNLAALLQRHGQVLDTIDQLKPGRHLPPDLWNTYSANINAVGKAAQQLRSAIRYCDQVLDRAERFQPESHNSESASAALALLKELELASGMQFRVKAFHDIRVRYGDKPKIVDGITPAARYHIDYVSNLLARYGEIQKHVDAATAEAKTSPGITIILTDDRTPLRRGEHLRFKEPKKQPGVLDSLGIDCDTPPTIPGGN